MYTAAAPSASQPALPIPDLLAQFRVRTVGEIIDAAFRIYRRNFLTFFLLVLLIAIPIQLISYAIDIFVLGRFDSSQITGALRPPTGTGSLTAYGPNGVATQLATVKDYLVNHILFLAQWPLTSALIKSIYGGTPTLRTAYSALTRNIGTVLGLVGLQILITIGIYSPLLLVLALTMASGSYGTLTILSCVSLAVTLTYFIIDVRLTVALPAALVEGLSPREALRRSLNLTHRYWWRTLALVLVLGLLASVIAAGPAALVTALFGFSLSNVYASLAVTRLVTILTTAIFLPIQMSAFALYYFDQRVRREGFDLEHAIDIRYQSGEYGEAPEPETYRFNPVLSYTEYAQPSFGYSASYESEYPANREQSRVRRVSISRSEVDASPLNGTASTFPEVQS